MESVIQRMEKARAAVNGIFEEMSSLRITKYRVDGIRKRYQSANHKWMYISAMIGLVGSGFFSNMIVAWKVDRRFLWIGLVIIILAAIGIWYLGLSHSRKKLEVQLADEQKELDELRSRGELLFRKAEDVVGILPKPYRYPFACDSIIRIIKEGGVSGISEACRRYKEEMDEIEEISTDGRLITKQEEILAILYPELENK